MQKLKWLLFVIAFAISLCSSQLVGAVSPGNDPANSTGWFTCAGGPTEQQGSENSMAAPCTAGQGNGQEFVEGHCGGAWYVLWDWLHVDEDDSCQVTYRMWFPNYNEYIYHTYGFSVTRCSPPFGGTVNTGCKPIVPKMEDAPKSCGRGNPIYPLTGVKRQDEELPFVVRGEQLRLTYSQKFYLPVANSAPSWTLTNKLPFGPAWQTNFNKSFTYFGIDPIGSPSGVFAIQTGGGEWVTFAYSSARNAFVSDIDPSDTATWSSAGLFRTDSRKNIEEQYAPNGTLSATYLAGGGKVTYLYDSSNLPTQVSDDFGRVILFDRQGGTYVQVITGPDGSTVNVSYAGDLISGFTWPDSSLKSFLYERPDLSWALTGIVDENHASDQLHFATFTYDAVGHAMSTGHWGLSDNFSLTYSKASSWSVKDSPSTNVIYRTYSWNAPTGLVLTLPSGSQSALTAVDVNGSLGQSSQTQAAGSGCDASTSAQTFDLGGNLASVDDFNGNRSCMGSDLSRNLRTTLVEGLPNTKACPGSLASYIPAPVDNGHPERKTTTVWHPDWALKSQEAEPKKITTWVYNGQPDPVAGGTAACVSPATTLPDGKPIAVVCTRYEQATSDTTGALGVSATVTGATRKWSYTYNQNGQVLTETTPQLSPTDTMSHTTTYVYYADTSITSGVGHTIGDLQSITNPLHQMTTFTSYDAAGRLLSSTDANGMSTTQSYWPRGWIKSQTVMPSGGAAAPQTTSYAYWPTGLLKTVTMPDASTLNYVYDDAHRLTDVSDTAGNKIHYVLDGSGNRTSEQITDASGNLASTVSRVFDALNRLQSQTGAAH